jgi:ADP-ribosylglycohydrolase
MMEETGKAVLLASLVADSLALGAHWIYDTRDIQERFGRVDSLLKPQPDSYHPTKEKGAFTHYGDQTLVLLESVAALDGFDLRDFFDRWVKLFEGYEGYVDQATKATLANIAAGRGPADAGSSSDELAGASRIAPIVCALRNDLPGLIDAARSQTTMTHNNALTADAAVFFGQVAWAVMHGTSPVQAMKAVSREQFGASPISQWVEAGIDSAGMDSIRAIAQFGQTCHTPHAFPGVVHLVAKYENDLKEALVQAVMAGGDSAARGMMVGMLLGAHLGDEGVPEDWITQLKERDKIMHLLEKIS